MTMQTYSGRPSSREKDLIDLVALATTQDVDGPDLAVAISSEARRRSLEQFTSFVVPANWGRSYAKMAKSVPYGADYPEVKQARELVSRFIDPALVRRAGHKRWAPEKREWI